MPTPDRQRADRERLGRQLRAGRVLAGYTRAKDAAVALSQTGVHVTERMVTGLERGETQLSFELAIVWTAVMKPPGGLTWLAAAVEAG